MLPEDDPETIQRLVNYLYTSNYTLDEADESTNVLLVHVRMFEVAVKYQVRNLERLVLEKFRAALSNMENVATKPPPAFIVQALREMYTKIPEKKGSPIRNEILKTKVIEWLPGVINMTDEFHELCTENGAIGHSFFLARMEHDYQKLTNITKEAQELRGKYEKAVKDLTVAKNEAVSQRLSLTGALENERRRADQAEKKVNSLRNQRDGLQEEIETHSRALVDFSKYARASTFQQVYLGVNNIVTLSTVDTSTQCRMTHCYSKDFILSMEKKSERQSLILKLKCIKCTHEHLLSPWK